MENKKLDTLKYQAHQSIKLVKNNLSLANSYNTTEKDLEKFISFCDEIIKSIQNYQNKNKK